MKALWVFSYSYILKVATDCGCFQNEQFHGGSSSIFFLNFRWCCHSPGRGIRAYYDITKGQLPQRGHAKEVKDQHVKLETQIVGYG